MKLALCQLNSIVGNYSENLDTIEKVVENLNYSRADIFVFPELFLTGYPPRDLLEHQWFIQQGASALDRLKAISLSIPEKAIITGMILPEEDEKGHSLHNAAIVVSNGELLFSQAKTLLPTYDVFDEHRYFKAAEKSTLFSFKGVHIGLAICEDMWNSPMQTSATRYNIDPISELAHMGAQIIVTIAASPFHIEKQRERFSLIKNHVETHRIPLIFLNSIGANDELIFDGGSLFVDSKGEIQQELPHFSESVTIVDTEEETDELPSPLRIDPTGAVFHALSLGIQDYFDKCNKTKATLVLSGGIDSAVTAALTAEALGTEKLEALIIRKRDSSDEELSDAKKLVENLGISYRELSMADFCNQPPYLTVEEKNPDYQDKRHAFLEERFIGAYVSSLAEQEGTTLLNSVNKSEIAVGTCTLYGDTNGELSILGDMYKSDVYRLAYYINRSSEIIPVSIINRTPSSERATAENTNNTIPANDDLDAILRLLLEDDRSSEEIVNMGYDTETVNWIVMAIKQNESKRRQMAPVLKVSPKAFGMGRRFPIAATYEW